MPEFPLVEELAPVPSLAEALRAFAGWPDVILFDSALPRPSLGRYSFLAADPVEFVQVSVPSLGVDPFEQLTLRMKEWTTPAIQDLPPFQGGAAGLLSYELGAAWERITPARVNEFEFPALAVGLYDWVLAWDHLQSRAWIISQGLPELDPDRRTKRAAERLAAVRRQLTTPSARDSSGVTVSPPGGTIPLP
ncbi:MAG: aminodeoxychorismate synthase, component I, partial [Planctomycetota bacterium]|nr:aminodeoxychorismate synthase, component I [Planctomycetota bacterium]